MTTGMIMRVSSLLGLPKRVNQSSLDLRSLANQARWQVRRFPIFVRLSNCVYGVFYGAGYCGYASSSCSADRPCNLQPMASSGITGRDATEKKLCHSS